MIKPTDKQRADAAEAKLAEVIHRQFDQAYRAYRESLADTKTPLGPKLAKLMRALADLLDSGLPMPAIASLFERLFPSPVTDPPVPHQPTEGTTP